jgi:hypothetical protein
VVRLPHAFDGGHLIVSFGGHSTMFDWSKSEPDSVDWAAFDKMCDHEVLDVTAGHRFCLIYDLYISEHVGGIFNSLPKLEPRQLPLYDVARSMFEQPSFLKHGTFTPLRTSCCRKL